MKILFPTLFCKNITNGIAVIIVLTIIAILLAGISACTDTTISDGSKSQQIGERPKGIEDCKYKISWSSNMIYTNSYDKAIVGDNEIITVHGYFEMGRDEWVWKGIDVKLDEKYFGEIKIVQQITDEGCLVETYLVPPVGIIGDWKKMDLKTIKVWKGNESKEFDFNADKTPWVLNADYVATSKISVNFSVNVWKDVKGLPGVREGPLTQTTRTGFYAVTVEEKGKFTIEVKASGCNWWVKTGAEP